MLTLAFESSAKSASVALLEDEHLLCQTIHCSGLTHSQTLLPMAEELLKTSGFSMDDVGCFAVAHGPGSFTGIRIGVSTVKGLAWAADKPCIGVSTLAAMAWNGLSSGAPVCAVMDARRSEVYNALFRIENGRPVRLCPDRAVSLQTLAEELQSFREPVFLTGDGAVLADSFLRGLNMQMVLAPEPQRMQNAWGVAMEAMDKLPESSQDLLPVYLRLSQAERERQAKIRKEKEAAAVG